MSLGVLYKVRDSAGRPGEQTRLLYDGIRLPKEAFETLRLADTVLREAEAAASHLRESSTRMFEARRREAHSQGFSQGHAQAIGGVLGTLEVEHRLRGLLADRLADLVERALRRLLGEIGDSLALRERVLHLVRTAQAPPSGATNSDRTRNSDLHHGGLRLHVCPGQVSEVQDILKDLSFNTENSSVRVTVVADDQRAPDALLLETQLGFIESQLELTIQETRDLVRHALARAMQVPGSTA